MVYTTRKNGDGLGMVYETEIGFTTLCLTNHQIDLPILAANIFLSKKLPKYSTSCHIIKGSLGGETSVLRTFRMSGKELVKERVSKERVRQGKS